LPTSIYHKSRQEKHQLMKYLIYAIILLITIPACVPQNTCSRAYTFNFPATLYPTQDTFSVGDTLWYEMTIGDQLEDMETGDIIDLSTLELYFEVLSARYDTTYFNDALFNFSFHVLEGDFQLAPPIGYIRTNMDDEKIKIAIVPQYSGGYVLTFVLGIDFVRTEIELGDECTEFITTNSRVLINNGNSTANNVSVLEDLYLIDDTDTLYWVEDGIRVEDIRDTYVFYVR